jgi:hypothetical protein
MADYDDVILGIEFLICARWDVAHGNILAVGNLCLFQLPGLADIEQSEPFTLLEQRLDLSAADFEVDDSAPGF